jgi:MurNAc alpha-1-phosphate uridylyltransferase
MSNSMLPMAILAGGLATRLHPVTETIPKALISINGEFFIHHQLRLLHQRGIRQVVLCVGFLGNLIEQNIGDGSQFGLHVQYAYDGDILLGTGGAIKQALPLLGDAFFVIYGDSYLDCDYAAIQTAFQQSNKQGLMTVFHNGGRWDTSNVEYVDGQIVRYDKKERNEQMQYIDYGVGVFTKEACLNIPGSKQYDLALLYQTLLNQHQLASYEVNKRFYEVGSFAGIKELEYYLPTQNNKDLLCNS